MSRWNEIEELDVPNEISRFKSRNDIEYSFSKCYNQFMTRDTEYCFDDCKFQSLIFGEDFHQNHFKDVSLISKTDRYFMLMDEI